MRFEGFWAHKNPSFKTNTVVFDFILQIVLSGTLFHSHACLYHNAFSW